jgi:diguanylate cyclase (GGDEF)-like protein
MRNHLHSIAMTVVAALFVSFLLPLSVGLVYSLLVERDKLNSELLRFHEDTMNALERVMHNALLNLEPAEAENAAKILIQDPRILRIRVYSSVYDMVLAQITKTAPGRNAEEVVKRRNVFRGNELIGHVEVAVDGMYYKTILTRERKDIVLIFSAMLTCGLLLIIPTIYVKVLRPVSRLMRQAETLTAGQLETPFTWRGNDELSRLGNALETMRRELHSSFVRIQEMAVTDELTGTLNRRAFLEEAGRALDLSRRYRRPLALALIDIDHFKRVNDTHGHAVGDEVLRQFAGLIESTVRKTDICARFGGEEFVVCMPETDLREASLVAEKIRVRVSAHPFPYGLRITASLGLAASTSTHSLDTLLQEADTAMYEAKSLGRDRVIAFTPQPEQTEAR